MAYSTVMRNSPTKQPGFFESPARLSSAISADREIGTLNYGRKSKLFKQITAGVASRETTIEKESEMTLIKQIKITDFVDSENMVVRMMKKPELQNFLKMIRGFNKEAKKERGGTLFHLRKNDMGYEVFAKHSGKVIRIVDALAFRHFYTVRMDSKLFNKV